MFDVWGTLAAGVLCAGELLSGERAEDEKPQGITAVGGGLTGEDEKRVRGLEKRIAELEKVWRVSKETHRLRKKGHYTALALRRRLLGEEHPDTAASYSSLAVNLYAQGNYAEAQPLYETALALRRRLLGEEHPDTARSYNSLAMNLYAQGNYARPSPSTKRPSRFEGGSSEKSTRTPPRATTASP
jgi:tetratricopeptide (TPR) repeat protein